MKRKLFVQIRKCQYWFRKNLKISFLTITGAVLFILLPTACTHKRVESLHVLVIHPIRAEIKPWSVEYAADYLIIASLANPFVELDENEKWSFPFCDSWKYGEASKIWICELRKNLRWSDGSIMEPESILESLKESIKTSRASGVNKLIQDVKLEKSGQLIISFQKDLPNALWSLSTLDQVILDPASREKMRTLGALPLNDGFKKTSGRFRLKTFSGNKVEIEPNPYFPNPEKRASFPLEILGNLSPDSITERLMNNTPGDIGQLLGGSVSAEALTQLQQKGLQKFDQPVPNAIAELFFGNPGRNKLSKPVRQFIASAVGLGMLERKSEIGMPAVGLSPPWMLGALDVNTWSTLLKSAPSHLDQSPKIDLFVMKGLAKNALYLNAKAILKTLPLQFNEIIYDPDDQESTAWKRRKANDFDLIFIYAESYFPDPDPFWREIRNLSEAPHTLYSEEDLDKALLETNLEKRKLLYQQIERRCVADPFIIPLRRFGNELFVTPGVSVDPQEAFGMMLNLWSFKVNP